MARLIFSINNNTAAPFTNKWPGGNPDYVPTSKLTKTVILGDGTESTIEVDHADPDFWDSNPINISCKHMGDMNNKSYFAVRDSDFVTWTNAEKTEYGYVEESLPLSEADTNVLIMKPDIEANTSNIAEASDKICDRFLDSTTANTAQAQIDAATFGYNFANNYTFNG